MAAYAAAVTLNQAVPIRFPGVADKIIHGTVNVTNYNSTLAEITGITSRFKTTPVVVLGGVSSNGYLVAWIPGSKSIKAWYPSISHNHVLRFQTSAAANAVTAAANQLRTAAAAFNVNGVPDATGEGGVVSAAASAGTEVANDVNVGSVPFMAIGI